MDLDQCLVVALGTVPSIDVAADMVGPAETVRPAATSATTSAALLPVFPEICVAVVPIFTSPRRLSRGLPIDLRSQGADRVFATQAAPAAEPAASNSLLVTAAVLGIAAVVLLITLGKVHPFLSLIAGAAVLGLVAGFGAEKTIESFSAGVGTTVGGVGLLIALGAMIGGLLADSGGADSIVDRVVHSVSENKLPWALAGVAALIGLPLFFEVGVVLLVPVVLLVSTRTRVPLMKIGIPALAGLSVLHGLVPPHPGPLVAISALKADLGLTLGLGLLIAIPTVIISGPVFGTFIGNRIRATVPAALLPTHEVVGAGSTGRSGDADVDRAVDREDDVDRYRALHDAAPGAAAPTGRRRPAFGPAVITIQCSCSCARSASSSSTRATPCVTC